MRKTRLAGLYSLALLFGLGAALEAAVRAGVIGSFVIPAPSAVIAAVPALFTEDGLGSACVATFLTIFAATALAVVVGVPSGALLAAHRRYGRAYGPWLEGAFAAPIILLYPMFLIFFGRSVVTVIVMGFLVAVIPVVLKTQEGVAGIPIVLTRVARSLHMTRSQAFRKVILPASAPSIFVGIRLALIYAMINVIAVEFLVGIGGLGNLVSELYDQYDVPEMYGAVAFVVLISAVFFFMVERFERWLKLA